MINFPKELYFFLLIQLLAVAWLDFKYRKISNVWILINLVVFGITYFYIRGDYNFNYLQVYYPIVFFVVGFAFYTLRIMGGGDSKYLVSMYLLIPLNFHESFLYNLLAITCAIGGAQFLYNSYKGRVLLKQFFKTKNASYLKKCYGKKFPFAPLILLSWIIFGMNNMDKLK